MISAEMRVPDLSIGTDETKDVGGAEEWGWTGCKQLLIFIVVVLLWIDPR